MSDVVIASIISACASLVVCLLGYSYADKKLLPFGANKAVLKEQLFKVYEPLNKAFNSEMVCSDICDTYKNVVLSNYSLISVKLYDFYVLLKRKSNDSIYLTREWYDIQEYISTNYNWIKKKLGYPYDEYAIDKRLLDSYEKKQNIKLASIFLTDLLLCLLAFVSIIKALTDPTSNEFLYICTAGISTGIIFAQISHYLQTAFQAKKKEANKKRRQENKNKI